MTASAGSDAYAQIIIDRIEWGFQPYILTFTFRPLPGSASAQADQMRQMCRKAFDFYLPHVIRRPRTPGFHDWLPVWALTLDLPVYKREKQVLRDVSINDGKHYAGMAVEPPHRRNGETLVEHFANRLPVYRSRCPGIDEIHVKPITHDIENVSDYTFKCLHRGQTTADDILLLPLSVSEVRPNPLLQGNSSIFAAS